MSLTPNNQYDRLLKLKIKLLSVIIISIAWRQLILTRDGLVCERSLRSKAPQSIKQKNIIEGIPRAERSFGKDNILAFDAFVKIEGIEGESTDGQHQGWIEILAYKTKLNQKVSSTKSSAGGTTAERADFKNISFLKLIDKSSPLLMLSCAEGKHFPNITIEICRAGGEKLKYFEYKLSNCLINCVNTSGGRGEFPAEVIYINYGKIEWGYVKQNRSHGGAEGQITTGWNLEKNCRI